MREVRCEECGKEIPEADVNVADGVAYCRACDFVTQLVDEAQVEMTGADGGMPAGCWWRDDGVEQEAGAVMRRPIGVLLMLFGATFGGVPMALFLAGVKVGKRRHVPGSTGAPMDWPIAAIFTTVGLILLIAGIVLVAGKVRVLIRDGKAQAASGLWPIRRMKRFDVAEVRDVQIVDSGARSNNRIVYAVGVRMKNRKWIKFGASLSEPRRKWLAATLAKRFATRTR